jgi:hypothetical protein
MSIDAIVPAFVVVVFVVFGIGLASAQIYAGSGGRRR